MYYSISLCTTGNYLDIRTALIGLRHLSTEAIPSRSFIFWRLANRAANRVELDNANSLSTPSSFHLIALVERSLRLPSLSGFHMITTITGERKRKAVGT